MRVTFAELMRSDMSSRETEEICPHEKRRMLCLHSSKAHKLPSTGGLCGIEGSDTSSRKAEEICPDGKKRKLYLHHFESAQAIASTSDCATLARSCVCVSHIRHPARADSQEIPPPQLSHYMALTTEGARAKTQRGNATHLIGRGPAIRVII